MNNFITPHQARGLTDEEYLHYASLGLLLVPDQRRLAEGGPSTEDWEAIEDENALLRGFIGDSLK